MRRWVLLLVALALAAGPVAFAPLATADDVCGGGVGPCIAVTVVDGVGAGSKHYVEWSDVTSDVPATESCLIRTKPGGPEVQSCIPPQPGLSIQGLLAGAGIPVSTVQLVQVNGENNNPSTLTADELATDPSPFASGWVPAFAELSGTTSLFYDRPLLDNDLDTNGNDGQSTEANGEMDVTVYVTGQVLHPTVTVSPTHTTAGEPITATATLPNSESAPGLTYTYAWNFYDGPITDADATTSHTYTRKNVSAYVVVTVERGIGTPEVAYGVSAPVEVQVGDPAPPPPTKNPDPGTGTGKKTHPKVGPNKGKGKRAGGASGHSSGTGQTKPTVAPTAQSTPTARSTPTSGATASAGSGDSAPTAPTSGPTGARGANASPRHPKATSAAVAAFGALVHGVVIDSAAQPLAAAPSSASIQASAPSARQRSAHPFDAKLLWWLLLPVLLGLGVLSEIRRPLSRRRAG